MKSTVDTSGLYGGLFGTGTLTASLPPDPNYGVPVNARLPALSNRKHLGVAIQVTIAIHVLALLLLLDWRFWPLSLAMVAVNHVVLAAAGLWPRSTLLGPNHRRLSAQASAAGEVALTIDDGPDPQITPQVLELLDRYGCKATFFCIGERVAAHPDIAREIVRRGHHIENHSQHHSMRFSTMGPAGACGEKYLRRKRRLVQ